MRKGDKASELKKLFKNIWNCFECFGSQHECERNFREIGVKEPRNFKRSIHIREPFVLPPYEMNGTLVKGFFGTGEVGDDTRVMFLMPRPSTGGPGDKVPDEADKILYRLLKKFGLEEAHITDFIKCRGPAKEQPERMLDNCVDKFLEREFEIVDPNVIIALGHAAEKLCKEQLNRKPKYVTHYSYRPKEEAEKRMKKNLMDIDELELKK